MTEVPAGVGSQTCVTDEQALAFYAVERRLPGLDTEGLRALQRALEHAATRMSDHATAIQYVRSVYVPSYGRCLCLFRATSHDVVRRVNEIAQIPFTSIAEAIEAEIAHGSLSE